MQEQVEKIFKEHNILFHKNEEITVATVVDLKQGFDLSLALLYSLLDARTAFYLSGGSTPKELYTRFAKDETLHVGAVGIVDERYGPKFHDKSNEKMIRETGLLRYLEIRGIPFYPILQPDASREETAAAYDQKFRELNSIFPKSLAIMGIGKDGHTSGIAPNRRDFKNPMFDPTQKNLLVSEFDDPKSFYGQRVGMTFLGLSMIDILLVLVFGEDKKEPLQAMFANGSEEEIPSRFFKRTDIAPKTILITDQSF